MEYMSEAEGMGAYEPEYDPYDDELGSGYWIQESGTRIQISKMADSHIKNCIRLCERKAMSANCTYDENVWESWIEDFRSELNDRSMKGISIKGKSKPTDTPRKKRKPAKCIKSQLKLVTTSKVDMLCHCGGEYVARIADLKRGWATSCSKRCAAIKREFGRPDATIIFK